MHQNGDKRGLNDFERGMAAAVTQADVYSDVYHLSIHLNTLEAVYLLGLSHATISGVYRE